MARSEKSGGGRELLRNPSSEPTQETHLLGPGTQIYTLIRDPKIFGTIAISTFGLQVALYTLAFKADSALGFDLIILAIALALTTALLIAVLWVNLFQLPHNLLDFNESLARARSEIEAATKVIQDENHSKHTQLIVDLEAQLKRARAHAQDLYARLSPHLITWGESVDVEMKAKEVLCISATMDWASWSIKEIIEDCIAKPTKKFCYLVHSDGDPTHESKLAENIRQILSEIAEQATINPNLKRLFEQIQIQFCPRDDTPSKNPITENLRPRSVDDVPRVVDIRDYFKRLPLGGDYVIYKGVIDESGNEPCERTFAVVSATWPDAGNPVQVAIHNDQENVDLRMQDIRQYGPVLNWFYMEWDRYVRSSRSGQG